MSQILSQLVRQEIRLRTVEDGPFEPRQPLDSLARAPRRAVSSGWALRSPIVERVLRGLARVLGRVHFLRLFWPVLRRSPERKVARHV